MSDNLDVRRFHEKFEVPVRDLPQPLEASELEFRVKFMQEELDEYRIAAIDGDLEKQFDALIDLVYVAHGTVLMHGFPWAEGWRRVQEKNMAKISAKDAGVTGRHAFDVVKPEGWTPPSHADLVTLTEPWPIENERKPAVIILEGPDGAGKTMLADELRRLTGLRSIHFSAPAKGESFDDTCWQYLGEICAAGDSTIIDRFHLSERVYGPICRGVDTMSEMFEASMLKTVRPVVVLCLPPFEVAQENWAKRNAQRAEMISQRDQYEAVYRAYEKIRTVLPTIQYDYTRDFAPDVLTRLQTIGFI